MSIKHRVRHLERDGATEMSLAKYEEDPDGEICGLVIYGSPAELRVCREPGEDMVAFDTRTAELALSHFGATKLLRLDADADKL